MEYVYVDFLGFLGYKVIEQLIPSSCAVFKVEHEGKTLVAKLGDQWYSHLTYRHVVREHEVLERAKDIGDLPKEVFFRDYTGKQPMALLVKEYIEGNTLEKVPRALSPAQRNILESQIAAFHDRGMAFFDFNSSASNILVTPEGKPCLFDFGSIYFQSEEPENFSFIKNRDFENLQALLNKFQNI